ncbi:MAG: hypothetical protein ACRDE2_14535 [Chitinophagaceae bacterium]
MRKAYLLLCITLTTGYYCSAQTNIFPSSGNVGIGTTTPGATLEVKPAVLSGGDVNRNVVLL